jgi:hypothetical protein
MKVSEYKSIAESLGKFATTREKATGPESLIGVQCSKSGLKLIAGTRTSAVVVGVSEYESDGEYAFAVNARPFLQGAKVLPARATVKLLVSKNRLTVQTEGGGKIDVLAEFQLHEAKFPKKPKRFGASGKVAAKDWKRISKFFKFISQKVSPGTIQLVGDTGYATIYSTTGSHYANLSFPASGLDGYAMAGYLDFFTGLVALVEDGELHWGPEGLVAQTPSATVICSPYLVSKYDDKSKTAEPPKEMEPWPVMKVDGVMANGFTVDRKNLIDIVKGQAPFDEHNRVTLTVDTGSLRVAPFGSDAGQEVPAVVTGKGIRSVNANYLNGLLSAMDSKEVTLGWASGQPAVSITAKDYEAWTILLAPAGL